ncbi:MAG: hypothetical protein BBJ60_09435 [Desulfobacterales bacterium S7086C20]|nr:MAG: hypothetical protein BBJ60_09435 [Desulfobacterales bacterium S7086C20]
MAYFGPIRCSPRFSILDAALLRLWCKTLCGLVLDQNLPFLDGHLLTGILLESRSSWMETRRLNQ